MDFIKDIAKPSERQLEAIRSMHKFPYTLLGGAAGGGKTYGLVIAMAYANIMFASAGNQDPVTMLATTDQKGAKERFLPAMRQLLVNNGLGEIKGATKDQPPGFHFKDPAYGVIRLVSLFKPNSLRGTQPWAAAIDEVTLLPEETWTDIRMATRFAGNATNPFGQSPIICASNPDGQHAFWVYEYFVNRTANTPLAIRSNYHRDDYNFIPAYLQDNPNAEFIKNYMHRLDGLPEVQRKAYLEGIWDIRQGLRFVKQPIQHPGPFKPPSHWPIIAGLDFGYSDETAVLWAAFDEQGHAHVFRESVTSQRSAIDVAQECRSYPARFFACDQAMWQRESHGDKIIDHWHGVNTRPFPNQGHPGNMAIQARIDAGTLHIHDCPNLSRCLAGVSFGQAPKLENLIPHQLTHCVYALGYLLMAGEGLRAEPPPPELTEYEVWFAERIRQSQRRRQVKRQRFINL